MKGILISGGTGLVGSNLTKLLKSKGFNVHHLSRNPDMDAQTPTFRWNIKEDYIDTNAFEGISHIIHLAGASIADKRWNASYKKVLSSSRIDSAKLLIKYIKTLPKKQIKTFISASAMGIYGDCGTSLISENHKAADNFMAQLCENWERASDEIETLGIRRVIFRIPLVLEKGAGALEKMELPAKMGIGSYFGNGQQIYSWVHIDDLSRMFLAAIEQENFKGAYNANAPETISNKLFSKALNSALNRPFIPAPAPKFILKLALGEFADSLYWSTNLSAEKIQKEGFSFKYPDLKKALEEIYS